MWNRLRHLSPLTWMVALLLLATVLRFAAWQSAPPGLRYDETTVVYEADEIRAGARPIYMDGSAEEALYHYLFAAAQDFIAPHLFTLRWLSAALSLIGVAAVYALGRRMFNARVGLLAAAIATGAFWSLMYSRLGLRIIAVTPFVGLALIFLWRGFSRSRRRDFIVSGMLFGLSAYTYAATRMIPVALIGFIIYLAIFNRAFLRKHGVNFALTILTAALIVLPMAYHIATVPAAERRLGEVEGPLDALQRGDVQPLINSTIITAGMFIASGDPEWLYNIPNRPVFDLLTGAIFFGAVILSLRRFRQPAYAFVLIWLLAGLLPAMLTWPAASNSHSFLAQTPAFLLVALGLDAIATRWPKYGGVFIADRVDRVLHGFAVRLLQPLGHRRHGAPRTARRRGDDCAADRSTPRRSTDRLQQRRGDALESVECDGVPAHRPDRLYGHPLVRCPIGLHLSAGADRSHVDQSRAG